MAFLLALATKTFMLANGRPSVWLTHAALPAMFADGGPSAWLTPAAPPSMFAYGGSSAWLTHAALPSMRALLPDMRFRRAGSFRVTTTFSLVAGLFLNVLLSHSRRA